MAKLEMISPISMQMKSLDLRYNYTPLSCSVLKWWDSVIVDYY